MSRATASTSSKRTSSEAEFNIARLLSERSVSRHPSEHDMVPATNITSPSSDLSAFGKVDYYINELTAKEDLNLIESNPAILEDLSKRIVKILENNSEEIVDLISYCYSQSTLLTKIVINKFDPTKLQEILRGKEADLLIPLANNSNATLGLDNSIIKTLILEKGLDANTINLNGKNVWNEMAEQGDWLGIIDLIELGRIDGLEKGSQTSIDLIKILSQGEDSGEKSTIIKHFSLCRDSLKGLSSIRHTFTKPPSVIFMLGNDDILRDEKAAAGIDCSKYKAEYLTLCKNAGSIGATLETSRDREISRTTLAETEKLGYLTGTTGISSVAASSLSPSYPRRRTAERSPSPEANPMPTEYRVKDKSRCTIL